MILGWSMYNAQPGFFPLTITSPSPLPNANQNQFYTDTLTATGGTPPYTWKILYLPVTDSSGNIIVDSSGQIVTSS